MRYIAFTILIYLIDMNGISLVVAKIIFILYRKFFFFFFVFFVTCPECHVRMYGNIVLIVNVDVATVYLGVRHHLLPIARRQTGSRSASLNSYPRALNYLNKCSSHSQFNSSKPCAYLCTLQWRQVYFSYEAHRVCL